MLADYEPLYRALRQGKLAAWAEILPEQVARVYRDRPHGDLPVWLSALAALPPIKAQGVDLNSDSVSVSAPLAEPEQEQIRQTLQSLHPWRKGPFHIHGIDIDAEWRCDMKWRRVSAAMAPLRGRTVLDVGCGNGYYAWRMLGAGAALVVGIDPSLRFVAQYQALRHFLGEHPAYVLPLTLEDMPDGLQAFDSVFSMGVLYHRRSPFDHLFKLRDCLRPGGELVLETLVVEGRDDTVLVPPGRYAQMRNVWFLPSPAALLTWLRRSGFKNARIVDVTATGSAEQRRTDWMRYLSLADFLDPQQLGKTCEGLPAPMRCIVIAEA